MSDTPQQVAESSQPVAQQMAAVDSSLLAGILQQIQEQSTQQRAEMQLLRDQMAHDATARATATEAQAQLLRDQAAQHSAQLLSVQQQHQQDVAALAAAIQSTGGNQGLPPDTVTPKNYPKVDDFKLVCASVPVKF